jgi:SAM-dependent methyltransferase
MTDDRLQHWQASFAGPDYRYGRTPNRFLAACRPLFPPHGRALAIADGEGRNGVFLAGCGLDVVSVDFSSNAQAKARRLAADHGVTIDFRLADILDWDWPEAEYDLVAAICIQFATPPERDRIFAGLKRALRPGGLLILTGYRPEQIALATGGPKETDKCYTSELLETAFADLAELEIREWDGVVDEGTHHRGPSALIDLHGRRA